MVCLPLSNKSEKGGHKQKARFRRDLNSDRWIQSPEC